MKKVPPVVTVLVIFFSLFLPGVPFFGSYARAQGGMEKDDPARTGEIAGEKSEEGTGGSGDGKPKVFGLEAGYNGAYAQGTSPKSFYSQPYLDIILKHKYVKFTAGISRFWDYQISNGAGDYETVNFTQPKAALSLYPHEVIELFGEYRYWTGDKSHYYKCHDGTVGFNLDFEIVYFGISATMNKAEYKFKSDDTESLLVNYRDISQYIPNRHSLALSLAYRTTKNRNVHHTSELSLRPNVSIFVHETTSIDLNYEYQKSLFEMYTSGNRTKNDEYYIHSGKVGITSDPADYISLNAAVSIGKDSQDYIIAGGDLGLAFHVLGYVSLSGSYGPAYYMPPPEKVWGREVSQSYREFRELWAIYSLVRWRNVNPYMRLSNIGKAFWSHGVSVSASVRY